MGKSKGYRTITLYLGERTPVFLLTVFGKGQKVNFVQGGAEPAQEDRGRICAEDAMGRRGKMSKSAFDSIAAGLNEALAVARGEARPARLHVPGEMDVKASRAATHMKQEDFAAVFGFSLTQIRDWEQGRSRPLRSDRAYLMLIAFNHERVLGMLGEVRKRDAREVA